MIADLDSQKNRSLAMDKYYSQRKELFKNITSLKLNGEDLYLGFIDRIDTLFPSTPIQQFIINDFTSSNEYNVVYRVMFRSPSRANIDQYKVIQLVGREENEENEESTIRFDSKANAFIFRINRDGDWGESQILPYTDTIKLFYHYYSTFIWYCEHIVPYEHWETVYLYGYVYKGQTSWMLAEPNYAKMVGTAYIHGLKDPVPFDELDSVIANTQYVGLQDLKAQFAELEEEYKKQLEAGKIDDKDVKHYYDEDYSPDYKVLSNSKVKPRLIIPAEELGYTQKSSLKKDAE